MIGETTAAAETKEKNKTFIFIHSYMASYIPVEKSVIARS